MNNTFNFFKEAVKSYKTSGTIVPSSKYLANKMLSHINFTKADVIVEFGSGNGVITKLILEKLSTKATLICFEINTTFYNELLQIKHPQLIVLNASAENIENELQQLGFKSANVIISSLPLTIIPNKLSNSILKKSNIALNKNGLFIQYQYSLTYYKKLRTFFDKNIQIAFEPLNFPPAFIYKCSKKKTVL